MLEATVTKFNWAYFDGRRMWICASSGCLCWWRLQGRGSIDQLIEEVATAFPDLLRHFTPDGYFSPMRLLDLLIGARFIDRFLQLWGFVSADQDGLSLGQVPKSRDPAAAEANVSVFRPSKG